MNIGQLNNLYLFTWYRQNRTSKEILYTGVFIVLYIFRIKFLVNTGGCDFSTWPVIILAVYFFFIISFDSDLIITVIFACAANLYTFCIVRHCGFAGGLNYPRRFVLLSADGLRSDHHVAYRNFVGRTRRRMCSGI